MIEAGGFLAEQGAKHHIRNKTSPSESSTASEDQYSSHAFQQCLGSLGLTEGMHFEKGLTAHPRRADQSYSIRSVHFLTLLSNFSLALVPAPANIQVSYFNDYHTCGNCDATVRYETIRRSVGSGNCFQGLLGYDALHPDDRRRRATQHLLAVLLW